MKCSNFNRPQPSLGKQSGAALLIALLAVVLAALMATSMIERSQHDLARTEALLNSERAWQYASGMNQLAIEWINQAENNSPAASQRLDGRWAPPLPVPGGTVTGRVIDISGQFNLNSLNQPIVEDALAARLALDRLFGYLNLDSNLAEEINAWIRSSSGGAGAVYSQSNPAFVRAGLPFAHLSELQWLQRYTPAAEQVLLPLINTLPESQSRININTTRPEILAAWVLGLSLEQAARVLAAGPFDSIEQVVNLPELARLNLRDFDRRFSTRSNWYMAQARVTLNGQTQDFFHLISRSGTGYDFRYVSQAVQEPALTAFNTR